MFNNIL